jgi:FkbM family methyltransferase
MNTARFKRNILHCFVYPFRFLPESKVKKELCKKILKIINSVPLYLAVNTGDTAIQVGTPNVRTMMRYSRLVGASGKVVIVEADPENADDLKSHMADLPFQNVTIVCKGAWSEPGTMTLEKSDEYKGDHKIKVDNVFVDNDLRTTFSNSVEIEVDTVDNILSELGVESIDYLSITVNGAELEVLKGSKEVIKQSDCCRIYSKGHSRVGDVENGDPLNVLIIEFFTNLGIDSVISRGERGPTEARHWQYREGDVFAWKGVSVS